MTRSRMKLLMISALGVATLGSFVGLRTVVAPARPKHAHPIRIIDPDNPCGPVAIAMVSHLLKRPILLRNLREALDVDPQRRVSMGQLRDCLESNDFAAVGVSIEPRMLATLGPSTAAILHVDGTHFIVAAGRDGGEVMIYDPPLPPAASTADALPYKWDGPCILVALKAEDLRRELARMGLQYPGRGR